MDRQKHQPRVAVRVTRAEYEQFLQDKTYIPDCLHLNGVGLPDCAGDCPKNLVCVMFVFTDQEDGIDAEWFACAPPEVVEQLTGRIVLADDVAEPHNDRKLKFLGFTT